MFLYHNHRFYWNNISFQIPNGFYLETEPEMEANAFLWLWFPDRQNSLTLHFFDDCMDTKTELENVISEITPQWSSPIEAITVNGLRGYHARYHLCHERYYEAWLQLEDSAAFNMVIKETTEQSDAEIAAIFSAIDPKWEQKA